MKQSLLSVIYTMFDLLSLWGDWAFDYYKERSEKVSVYFYCRENKYTKRKYFRTMRPMYNGLSDNEWIEYTGKIDNVIK
jgi:hypoxanthine phosphoribosyltransferase